MERYIAFLRGINVSGKNKIPMSELKAGFEKIGFVEVNTHLNSGNVVFSSHEADKENLRNRLERMIKDRFNLDIPVFVLSKQELEDILQSAPDWWGTESKELYDNLIFLMPPTTFAEVLGAIGGPKKELEKIQAYKEAIFWSFDRKNYQKTNWWSKTASDDVGRRLTIRTANTVRKLVGM